MSDQWNPTSPRPEERGCVVWFTGLPSAGKSTLAGLFATELQRRSRRVELLDGDEVRRWLTKGLGFTKAERDENVRRVGYVAHLLARHGVVAIVAMISPYRAVRDEVRARVGDFIEVYVECDRDECVRRDPKGLYKRALAGELLNFTGVSDPYEPPLSPEVTVRTDRETPGESLAVIMAVLEQRGHLEPARTTR